MIHWTLFYRKLIAGVGTIIVATLCLTLVFFIMSAGDPSSLLFSIGVIAYVSAGIVFYGFPVSVLAEVLLPDNISHRWSYALLIHIGFVLIPLIIWKMIEPGYETLSYLIIITPVAFLYWLLDKALIRWKPGFKMKETKLSRILYGIPCGFVLLFSLIWANEALNDALIPLARYEIPEGHSGWVYVFYEMEDEPKLEEDGNYRVINLNKEGFTKTSTVYKGSAISENEYFYVDEKGEKTKIPESQIPFGSVSGFSEFYGAKEVHYEAIEMFFIGTKEEYEKSEEPNYSKFIPKPDPDREKYRFILPEGFTGWVKIEKDPDVQITERTFEVDQEGIVFVRYDISSIEPAYDQFYYQDGEDLMQIEEDHVSELYQFPDLKVFYIGPQEDFEPFKYEEYISKQ
ncbi:DUF6843 domain-containing protein [Pseudalkalibacillus sp. A8]|uniref:DUF6843 domain-containing protein n=1 Tax=Pseudalkalibacillus sp. A8 TaxID=3382641 RepID=UPI0038B4C678